MNYLSNSQIIPVLMFHSVGLENHPWVWSHIAESFAVFERKCNLFSQKYNTVHWEELYQHMNGNHKISSNSLMLTFDDGYLDNWVYVYPILKKLKLKATIFVNTDFVDPSTALRPNMDDVWSGRCSRSELQPAGFLNWSEMRVMEASGLVDIQSHSKSHTWYFSGSEIIGYHKLVDIPNYPWLFWNEKPDRKPFYLTENQQGFLPIGSPIFQHEKSLVVKRYYPDERLIDEITDYAQSQGVDFLDSHNCLETLKRFGSRIMTEKGYEGYFESFSERRKRIFKELHHSKDAIEHNLRKKVEFICWPGGGNDQLVHDIAREVGYKSWTLGSQDLSDFRNILGADPEKAKRIGTNNKFSIKGIGNGTGGAWFQLLKIEAHKGSFFAKQIGRLYKLLFLFSKQGY